MVSDKVKAMLTLSGKRQIDLGAHFGMSKQSIQNKMARDSWSVKDLVKAAAFCDYTVSLLGPDGQRIVISPDELDTSD